MSFLFSVEDASITIVMKNECEVTLSFEFGCGEVALLCKSDQHEVDRWQL